MCAWDLGPGISVLRRGPAASLGKKDDILVADTAKEREVRRDTELCEVLETRLVRTEAEATARRPALVRREAIGSYTENQGSGGERRR